MPRNWFSVQPASNSAPATVSIRGYIGDWGCDAQSLLDQISYLGDVEEMHVYINSLGGKLHEALAIFNGLTQHQAHIHTHVEGIAASAASVIFMAGDTRHMPANTLLMVHEPFYEEGEGDGDEGLGAWKSALLETYRARTGMDEPALRAMFESGDTFMTAAQAKAGGWCDLVEPIPERAQASSATAALVLACAAGGLPEEAVRAAAARMEKETTELETQGLPNGDGITPDPEVGQGATVEPVQATITLANHVASLAKAAGLDPHLSAFLLDPQITDATSAQAAIAQAREVADLCTQLGMTEQSAGLIQSRADIAQAKTALLDAWSAQAASNIKTQLPASQQASPPQDQSAKKEAKAVWAKVTGEMKKKSSPNRQTKE
jgi:ATP-dependent protease ClpP protease subunit